MIGQNYNYEDYNTGRQSKAKKSTSKKRFNNDAIREEPVLLSAVMAPLRGGQRAYRFLSSVKGFGVVASIMTCYCAGLSIEAIYVATPNATAIVQGAEYSEEDKAARRFLPKPYVQDGAELGRLNPIPSFQRAVLQRIFPWMPRWIRGSIQNPYWTIWDEPGILFVSVATALVIQRFEGIIWRKRGLKELRTDFDEMNSVKQVTPDDEAVMVAVVKATEHNSYGMGSVAGTFIAVVVLYGLEIGAFIGSFAGAGNWAVNTVYAILTIGGFEIFDRLDDSAWEKKGGSVNGL